MEYYQGSIIKFQIWHNHLNGTTEKLKVIWSWTYVELLSTLIDLQQAMLEPGYEETQFLKMAYK